jgi:Family of unknown function (DUF5338)
MNTQEKKVAAFLERIGERLRDSPGALRSGKHRVAFTALRPFIDGALAGGYTMRTTWAALREEKRVSMSYETFRMHCRRAGIGAGSGAASPPEEAPRGRHGSVPGRGDIN